MEKKHDMRPLTVWTTLMAGKEFQKKKNRMQRNNFNLVKHNTVLISTRLVLQARSIVSRERGWFST